MPRLNWTVPARDDLRQINAWLTENRTGSFAAQTVRKIRARAAFLGNFPHGGRPGKDGIRVLRVHDTPLLILYRLPDGNTVDVLRVRHEREDWLIER